VDKTFNDKVKVIADGVRDVRSEIDVEPLRLLHDQYDVLPLELPLVQPGTASDFHWKCRSTAASAVSVARKVGELLMKNLPASVSEAS